MGVVANKKTIYLMNLWVLGLSPIGRIRILQGIGLDSLRLPNHRRARDGFIQISEDDPQNKILGWFDAHEARPAREILLARVDLILEMHTEPLAKLKENNINA